MKLLHRNFLVFSGVWTYLVDAYPAYAASALAANTCARCVFAAAFPLFGDQSKWYQCSELHENQANDERSVQ